MAPTMMTMMKLDGGASFELYEGLMSHYLRTVDGTAASSAEKGAAWARGRSVASRVGARNAEVGKDAYDRLSLPSLSWS